MDKKGVLIFEVAVWIMRIVLVILIIMGVALQIRTYIDARVNLYFAEPALIIQVIGNSPYYFYQDASGNYQRAISVERFETAGPLLNLAFSYGQRRHAAANLTLMEKDGKAIKSILLNPKYYDELAMQKPLLAGKIVDITARQWPVEIIEKGIERRGILKVEVLQPV